MNQLAFGRINAYRKYELFMERYRSAAEIVRREIPLNPETRFLDVGCGNGIMKFFFDDVEGTWHGIEAWAERVACCEKLGYKVAEINIESTAFPYPDGSFDTVFASHVIEHLNDPTRAIRECARVLKPGGLLFSGNTHQTALLCRAYQLVASFCTKKIERNAECFLGPLLAPPCGPGGLIGSCNPLEAC